MELDGFHGIGFDQEGMLKGEGHDPGRGKGRARKELEGVRVREGDRAEVGAYGRKGEDAHVLGAPALNKGIPLRGGEGTTVEEEGCGRRRRERRACMAKHSDFFPAWKEPRIQGLSQKGMRMEPDAPVFYQGMEGHGFFPALRISEERRIPLGIRKAMEEAMNGRWR